MVYVGDISTVFMGLETNKHNLGGTTLHGFSAWIEIPSLRRWSFFFYILFFDWKILFYQFYPKKRQWFLGSGKFEQGWNCNVFKPLNSSCRYWNEVCVCVGSLGLWSIAKDTCLLGKTPLDWCRSAWFFIASSVSCCTTFPDWWTPYSGGVSSWIQSFCWIQI